MSGFISALTNAETGLTGATLTGVMTDIVPFIVIVVPVALGLHFVRKLIKGASKGKVRF